MSDSADGYFVPSTLPTTVPISIVHRGVYTVFPTIQYRAIGNGRMHDVDRCAKITTSTIAQMQTGRRETAIEVNSIIVHVAFRSDVLPAYDPKKVSDT